MTVADPRYVAARRVLLDALVALEAHRDALVIAGAQAVYLHTGAGDLGVAPFTTDADLALNPELLGPDPLLDPTLRESGFVPALIDGHVEPGMWRRTVTVEGEDVVVPVDLIVPDAVAGPGRRGARLGLHGKTAAHRARGLEAALVDFAPAVVTALAGDDPRSVTVNVAGPAALVVAKVHKINDRLTSRRSDRLADKDAADVFRLMQHTSPAELGTTLAGLVGDPLAGVVTGEAVGHLRQQFGRRGLPGVQMAARALRLAVPAAQVEAICVGYVGAALAVVRDS